MPLIVALVFSFALTTALGHIVHWAMHQPWCGPLYIAHSDHHQRYKKDSFTKSAYESSSSFIGFVIVFFIVAGIATVLTTLQIVTWKSTSMFLLATAVFAALTEIAHTAVHTDERKLPKIIAENFFFQRIKLMHIIHHANVKKNFGILVFIWDRILGTFKNIKSLTGR